MRHEEAEDAAEDKADGTPQEETGENAEDMEVDNDTDFLVHRLLFPKGNEEEVKKAEREYEVIDPRQRSAQAKQDERERKKHSRPRGAGRPYRR